MMMRRLPHARRAFSSMATVAPPTQVSVLQNQLRVASENSGGSTATVGVWIDTGSRYESDSNNGVAHFLEHLAFKGTAKRTQRAFEIEVENMGAHLNAYTSREQTVYYAKVLKKDVPKAVEILSDILLNSTYSQHAVEVERSVILREMEEVDKNLEEVIFDRLHEVAFVGTPLSRTILGPVENIKSITSDDIVRFVKTHYTAPRMVVAASGAVDHDELVKVTSDYMGGVPTEAPAGYEYDYVPSLFSGADVRDYRDDFPIAHMAIAHEGLKWTDPDLFTLMLFQTLLGSYSKMSTGAPHMNAPVPAAFAKYGGAETAQPFCTCYNDTGLFGFYLTTPPPTAYDQAEELMQIVQDEMVSLCTGVSDEDLIRAKAQLKFNMAQQLDNTSSAAEEIGRQLLTFQRRMPLAETFARIDAINGADVKRVAEKVIWDQEVAFAAMGPGLKYVGDLNALRRGTYWNRY